MTVMTMRSAEVGWQLFAASEPSPSLEAINEALAQRGLPTVSARMYDHYGRLVRHGYDRYVPINELDMAIKSQRRRRKEMQR